MDLNYGFVRVHSRGCDLWMHLFLILFQAVSCHMKLKTVRTIWVVFNFEVVDFVVVREIVIEVILCVIIR